MRRGCSSGPAIRRGLARASSCPAARPRRCSSATGDSFRLRFAIDTPLENYLDRYAEVPLPPYIARAPDSEDDERYQTVYARHAGAVAAPTAGLHFDLPMLTRLSASGIVLAYVTLHVGAGTFQPVEAEDLSRHRMHSERFSIPAATVAAVEAAHAARRSVIAVGTTSLRALESSAGTAACVPAKRKRRCSSLRGIASGSSIAC